MITVGLDFGTHQTKICVETRSGAETHYTFVKYADREGVMKYTLPSVVNIMDDGLIEYGYISDRPGKEKRYFKQAVCRNSDSPGMTVWEAARYSIWYLAYIIFDLEERYGQAFNIQMGVPTDSERLDDMKAIAVTLVASAYKLVEDVFKNKKDDFLKCKIDDLIKKTEIVRYTDDVKRNYGILVFPEAYACLMPMVSRGKIAHGMNLVIDIGGGTTDISFFTIEEVRDKSRIYRPQVYDFYSIGKGLNYLAGNDMTSIPNYSEAVHVIQNDELLLDKKTVYHKEISAICDHIADALKSEWKLQTELMEFRLKDALKNRPVVYTGGGSTLSRLRIPYNGFAEVHMISYDNWKKNLFDDEEMFKNNKLCPVLSTAYGLSIGVTNDNIEKKPFRDIFKDRRGDKEDSQNKARSLGRDYGGFDYGDDWDAWK